MTDTNERMSDEQINETIVYAGESDIAEDVLVVNLLAIVAQLRTDLAAANERAEKAIRSHQASLDEAHGWVDTLAAQVNVLREGLATTPQKIRELSEFTNPKYREKVCQVGDVIENSHIKPTLTAATEAGAEVGKGGYRNDQ